MLKKKVQGFWLITFLLLFTACQTSTKPKFAVAANLLFPMQEILQAYHTETGKSFDLISGSSGVLSAQIQNGAPFDLFFSANMKYPEALYQKKITQEEPRVIVTGTSVFWSKNPIDPLNIPQYLQSEKVQTLAIANPELAPYGSQASEWLENQGFSESWNTQLIVGENVGQVNQYIRLGSVDAAFTAISSRHAAQLKEVGNWYSLDLEKEARIPHGLLLLSVDSEEAKAILQFLQTNKAQSIFHTYGYQSP